MSLVVCVVVVVLCLLAAVVCACWLLFSAWFFRVGNCVHFIVICHIFESLCWLIIMSMRGGALKRFTALTCPG